MRLATANPFRAFGELHLPIDTASSDCVARHVVRTLRRFGAAGFANSLTARTCGWVDISASPDTSSVTWVAICKGQPIGVMHRSEKQYENFLLHVEWRHMEPGSNSGVFARSEGRAEGRRLPRDGNQMLELDWVKLHEQKDSTEPPIAYVHGELFDANGLTTVPVNPRSNLSGRLRTVPAAASVERIRRRLRRRHCEARRERKVRQRRQPCIGEEGCTCPQIGRAEIRFRTIHILELPQHHCTPGQTVLIVKSNLVIDLPTLRHDR